MSKAVLELQNLHKSFGALQATRDLSFCVNAGEIHALIGPNGAGKTTLFNVFRLRPPSDRIFLESKDGNQEAIFFGNLTSNRFTRVT